MPGGDDYHNRRVLSYHYYCAISSLAPVPGNRTIPVVDRVLCDDIEGPALFNSVQIALMMWTITVTQSRVNSFWKFVLV